MRFFFFPALAATVLAQATAAQNLSGSNDKVALDIIRMKACEEAWNYHVQDNVNSGVNLSAENMSDPTGVPYNVGNISGTKYSFSGNTAADQDICGWYFIPDGATAGAQTRAIESAMPAFEQAGNQIVDALFALPADQARARAALHDKIVAAISQYRRLEQFPINPCRIRRP